MPTLSMFFGIIIGMDKKIGGKHNCPHIHADYGDDEAVFVFERNILKKTSGKNERMVQTWIDIHIRHNYNVLAEISVYIGGWPNEKENIERHRYFYWFGSIVYFDLGSR